jgi:AcrR family transcriptional regulator
MAAPQRLSRQEARAATRARLLTAAAEVFAEQGFAGAAVEDIAARAGFTRGAFYSNFASKDELFLALVDEHTAREIDDVGALMAEAGSPTELFELLRARGRLRSDPRWFLLYTEFMLYALRNPALRPKLAARERTARRAYTQAVIAQLHALGVDPPAAPDLMALIVQALDHGLAIEQHVDPEHITDVQFADALALLLDAVVALSTQTTTPATADVARGGKRAKR